MDKAVGDKAAGKAEAKGLDRRAKNTDSGKATEDKSKGQAKAKGGKDDNQAHSKGHGVAAEGEAAAPVDTLDFDKAESAKSEEDCSSAASEWALR